MCDSGSQARQLSPSLTRSTSRQARTLEQMLPWVSMTPFGWPVGGAHAQARVIGQRPFEARLRENGHAVARPDAELEQAGAERLHAIRHLPVRDRPPRPVGLVPERRGMIGVPLHGAEEQLGQGAGAHGTNRTVNRIGEPGRRALTPRLALAGTSTLAGAGPAMMRCLTAATPRASVVTGTVVVRVRPGTPDNNV